MQDIIDTQNAIAQFSAYYPFELDQFQREAIDLFMDGNSVMVAAPTGTGKTIVAEFGVYESFRRGGRVMYTSPIKALSNQKFRDLRAIYGENVGLLTGDVSENPHAPIVVMTTEVLRNMLLQTPWELDAVDCVIFDEVHYIADPERGTTWEEAIILCPEHVQLICLSATVSNAQEIADWISRTQRPIRLITHLKRAVPLELSYYLDQELHLVIDHTGQQVADFPHTGGEVRRQMFRRTLTQEQRREAEQAEPQPWEIIETLSGRAMLPAIYFLFSRRDCEEFAQRLAVMRLGLLKDPEAARRIEGVIENHLGGLRPEDRDLGQVQVIVSLARKGIGFHHAGLLPILKQLVETLFGQGLMQVVFATETLALGVNMPARTVVIGRMSKWDGRRRRPLIPNEYQQMAGRAGRRGMDIKGNVIVPYSPWIPFHETLDIVTGELEPVRSAFAIRYNTVLNLWDPPHGNRVRQILQQSLTQFQTARRVRDIEDEILQVGRRIEKIPQECLIGLEGGDALLDEYHGLGSSLTALRGKERRLTRDIGALTANLDDCPWPEPGRQALRRLFKTIEPGTVVHLRVGGWAVYLGRGTSGGVGLVLTDHRVTQVSEYRQIDYLPSPSRPVAIPAALGGLEKPVDDVRLLISQAELDGIWEQVRAVDLPDLDAAAQEHRRKLEQQIGPERMSMEEERRELKQQIHSLGQAQLQHPCRTCPRRKEHQSYRKAIVVLEQERSALEVDLGRELTSEEERIRGIIRGIRTVLHRFDYLHRGYPTAKADTLADVFDTNGLIICEMVDREILQNLPPADTAEVFSWFAYDRDFRFTNRYTLPNHLIHLKHRLQDIEQQVLATERRNNLFISTGHNDAFYGAMRAWCLGATMAQILDRMDLSEGDLVLTFNKTIDLMRQVREMLAHAMPNHPLREVLAAAEELVRRDIVEQSLTIGFLPLGEGNGVPDDEAVIVEGA